MRTTDSDPPLPICNNNEHCDSGQSSLDLFELGALQLERTKLNLFCTSHVLTFLVSFKSVMNATQKSFYIMVEVHSYIYGRGPMLNCIVVWFHGGCSACVHAVGDMKVHVSCQCILFWLEVILVLKLGDCVHTVITKHKHCFVKVEELSEFSMRMVVFFFCSTVCALT